MSGRADRRPGEFELIEKYLKPLATDAAALDLADDAALVRPPPDADLVITADMVVETVHFFSEDAAGSVARKALGVNLSDLAGKGATPLGYLLCLALPADWQVAWLESFVEGLREGQTRHRISLFGGDTIRSAGGVAVSITAIGSVPKGRMVTRSGARAGDLVYVSGTIGDAALGLALRNRSIAAEVAGEGAAHLLDRYLHPRPRLELSGALRNSAHAGMDVSDGLVGDLAHLCEASGVGARIEAARVPLSDAAARVVGNVAGALETALTGGDDYEVLAAVPEGAAARFEQEATASGVRVTRIGRFEGQAGPPVVIGPDGGELTFARLSHVQF